MVENVKTPARLIHSYLWGFETADGLIFICSLQGRPGRAGQKGQRGIDGEKVKDSAALASYLKHRT